MRPAWMDTIVDNLEKHFYGNLKNTDIAKTLISDYPKQSIEELAETMAEGMNKSMCGDQARILSKHYGEFPNFDKICKEAFKNTMIRLLSEVKK